MDDGPIHLHIAEQTQEVDDCIAATGARPIEALCRDFALDARWQLVHATHATPAEIDAVARSGAGVVICPGTEGNLGDGRFKGGYSTRHYGRPAEGVHAVQMEMCWDCYMTPPHDYDETRAATVLPVLRALAETLIGWQP